MKQIPSLSPRFVASCVLPVALVLLAGCGGGPSEELPELGEVTGTVTLDGQPLAEASVIFEPQGPGAISTATTDESGEYELMFNADVAGAVVGNHTVRISKREMEAGPEVLPPKYNENSELTVEVQAGENTHDFALTGR